jgi:hypothetical protein
MGVINRRLRFMGKYGREQDKAALAQHVSDVLNEPQHNLRDHIIVRSQIAQDADLPLTSEHVHKIIDTKNPEDLYMTHPMVALAKYHFGDLKDEHWDKILHHSADKDIMGMMANLHSDHLERVASDRNRPADVRMMAKRQHHWASMREAESGTSIPAGNE